MAHGASLEVARKIRTYKDFAHTWGLSGSFTVSDESGRKTTFGLGGSTRLHMLGILSNYFNDFKSDNLSGLQLKYDYKKIQASLEKGLDKSSNIDPEMIKQIQSGHEEPLPLVLLGGSDRPCSFFDPMSYCKRHGIDYLQ